MPKKEANLKNKIKSTVETYNKIAQLYTESTKNKLLQFQLSHFISMIPKKGRILDAGCGCGRDSAYLKEDGLEVISIDFSVGLIEEAKKLNVEVKKEDLLKIKYKEEFDGIWCMATLGDIPKSESKKLIKNLSNALKKGGIIYLAVKEGEGEKIISKEEYDNIPRTYVFYKKEELENLLKENGFKIIESNLSNDEGTNWIETFAKKG